MVLQRQSFVKEDAEIPHGRIRVYGSIRQQRGGCLRLVFHRRSGVRTGDRVTLIGLTQLLKALT